MSSKPHRCGCSLFWLVVGLGVVAWLAFSAVILWALPAAFAPARAADLEGQFLEVSFKACRLDNHKVCQERAIQVAQESVTPQQCMAKALEGLTQWAEGHPEWFIARWTCRRPGTYAKA